MRIIISAILVVAIVTAGAFLIHSQPQFVDHLLYTYPCDQPIEYHLGQIDERFKLSQDEVNSDIDEATNLWSKSFGKSLFASNPTSKLTVNFIYDERQGLVTQINSLESQADKDKSSLDAKISAFNSKAANFEKRVRSLNDEIASWNSKGGAPQDVFERLTKEQQDLQSEGKQLQAEGNSLNQSTKNFNFQVGQINDSVNNFNSLLAQKPEEGLFDGREQTISIYFDNSKDELVHTLAHEFGHALGMEHVSNKSAIMYSYTSQSTTLENEDLAELKRVCEKVSNWETLRTMISKRLNSGISL